MDSMLTEKEKLAQRDSFIVSSFGIDTFHTLFMFKQNSLGTLSTIGFIGQLIEKIADKNIFPTNLSEEQIIQIKQYLILDIISKLLTIIEGLLVLVHSLSVDYTTTTKNMIKYPLNLQWMVIKNLLQNKYDLEKVFALPSITELPLTTEEKTDLKCIYQKNSSNIREALLMLGKFYEKCNIIYNKSKHGLSLSPLSFISPISKKEFENSSLSAFDHKNNESDMPKDHYISTLDNNSDSIWFNVESRVNFNKKLFSEIGTVINHLEILCTTVVDNHLTFANNCGQNYLPVHETSSGKYSISFLINNASGNEIKLLETLNKKILENMLVNPFEYHMTRNYTKKPLSDAVINDSIINIFINTSNVNTNQ